MISKGSFDFIDDDERFLIVFRPGSACYVNLKEKERINWCYYSSQGTKLYSTEAINNSNILINYQYSNQKTTITSIYQALLTINHNSQPRMIIKHLEKKHNEQL